MSIDLDHLFLIQAKWRDGNLVSIQGLHSDPGDVLRKSSNLTIEKIKVMPNGVYESKVSLAGITNQNSSFFPTHWDEEMVVQKIFEAAENLTDHSVESDGILEVQGITAEGIKIHICVNKARGKIMAAWPLLE